MVQSRHPILPKTYERQGNSMKKPKKAMSRYAVYVFLLLLYFAVCLFVFFISIKTAINKNIKKDLLNMLEHQSYNIGTTLTEQLRMLESFADYLAGCEQLDPDDAMQLMQSVTKNSMMDRVYVINADGTAYTSEGGIYQVAERSYFVRAMQGESVIIDQEASMADGRDKVVLAVPITDGEEIRGVLGGSYDVDTIRLLEFQDIYEGAGSSFVMRTDGTVISGDGVVADNIFTQWLTDENTQELLSRLRSDMEEGRSGCIDTVWMDGERSYFCYCPMESGDWVLCYVMNAGEIEADYDFVTIHELILIGVLLAGVGICACAVSLNVYQNHKILKSKAMQDPLTGLLNREAMKRQIDEILQDSTEDRVHSLVMLDLDNFKRINDICGHAAGDDVLRQVASALERMFRPTDSIARIGGDEFMIFLKDIGDREYAGERLEQMAERIGKIDLDGRTEHVFCSVGAAFWPEDARTLRGLYEKADAAMYQAKKEGKNRVVLFSEQSDE